MKFSETREGYRLTCLSGNYSMNTMKMYDWVLNELAKFLGNPQVEEITSKDLQRFMFHMKYNYRTRKGEHLKDASIDNCWKCIRSYFGWAFVELDLPRPDTRLERPKYTSNEVDPFTMDEIIALFRACDYTKEYNVKDGIKPFRRKRETALRDRALIFVLLDTGMRVSEACRLKVQDVDMDTGEVKIAPFGTGQKTKAHTVQIGVKARTAVWKYLHRHKRFPEDPLFTAIRGGFPTPMDQHTVNHVLHSIGKNAGIKDVHPHRFRHTFAIEYLRNGGDVFSLQAILGHKTLTMVQKYLKLAQTDIAEAHRRASPGDRVRL